MKPSQAGAAGPAMPELPPLELPPLELPLLDELLELPPLEELLELPLLDELLELPEELLEPPDEEDLPPSVSSSSSSTPEEAQAKMAKVERAKRAGKCRRMAESFILFEDGRGRNEIAKCGGEWHANRARVTENVRCAERGGAPRGGFGRGRGAYDNRRELVVE